MINELCEICNKPVLPDQGYHGASGNHWTCVEEQKKKVVDDLLRSKKIVFNLIADKHAPKRATKIVTENQLFNIAEEYAEFMLKVNKV